jgi:Concanavalin A-like lectin/glucanases superfamily
MASKAAPQPGQTYLSFNGSSAYVEIPSRAEYSVDTNQALTVSAWMSADVEIFLRPECGKYYVHWMGKGQTFGDGGNQEWVCRMYTKPAPEPDGDRTKRTSFYVFNPAGGLGVGSYVQEDVPVKTWRLIVGVADDRRTRLYRNGELTHCDTYRGEGTSDCKIMTHDGQQVVINPVHGDAPLRIGTQNFDSFFMGGITRVRIWGRALTPDEIKALYQADEDPPDGLVAEFMLDSDTGTTAIDSSSLANHGVIVDGIWAKVQA